MIWGPFLLALALGLVVSAGLYFAYLWPAVEPATDDEAAANPAVPEPAKAEAGEPAKAEAPEGPSATSEPETAADAPAPESSPT